MRQRALNADHVTINKAITRATTGAVSFAFHEPVTFPLSSPLELLVYLTGRRLV